jgi:hypothetical protein
MKITYLIHSLIQKLQKLKLFIMFILHIKSELKSTKRNNAELQPDWLVEVTALLLHYPFDYLVAKKDEL